MKYYDVFNGDADGICSLHQLRMTQPRVSALVTGVKRDIKLLKKISAQSQDKITVLDISFQKNVEDIDRLLKTGCSIEYFDHHYAGEITSNSNLTTHIYTEPNICTSLIVNNFIKSKYIGWALVGTFGDNLNKTAIALAKQIKITAKELKSLENLGNYINYNSYGESIDDLHIHPVKLYKSLSEYTNPLEFINSEEVFELLESGFNDDNKNLLNIIPDHSDNKSEIYFLPNELWAHRIIGLFSNNLAQKNRKKAHAILIEMDEGFKVSVRAPLEKPIGADELCLRFDSGGGRKAAAGINNLVRKDLEEFIGNFLKHKWQY